MWQPESVQQGEKIGMFFQLDAFDRAGAIKNDSERAPGHKRGIELLQRTGCCVARIGERRQALFDAIGIHFFEPVLIHENFAAHFKDGRRIPFEPPRD
jgi:hypothetical protein